MRIFIFKSEANPNLRAFDGDLVGSQQPPYNLPRDVIETAINDQGFQLFRLGKGE